MNIHKGAIFGNQIGYITPFNNWKEWNLAGLSYEKSIAEVTENIQQHVFPIFDIFNSKEKTIGFLKNNGIQLNKWSEPSLLSLDFLLGFSEQETAELFSNNFISHCPYKSKIIKLYETLETESHIEWNHSNLFDADKIKLAFVKGLKIK